MVPRSLAGRDAINRGGKCWIGGEEQGFSWGHGTSVMSAKSQKKTALNVFAKRIWKRSQGWIRTVGVTGTRLLSAAMAMISHGGETRQKSRISSGMQRTFKRPGPACGTDSDPQQLRPAQLMSKKANSHTWWSQTTYPWQVAVSHNLAWLKRGRFIKLKNQTTEWKSS